MYVNGVRASEAEVADTAESFSNLMGEVKKRANECNDPHVAFSGKRETNIHPCDVATHVHTQEPSLFAVSVTHWIRYAEALHNMLLTVVSSICF